MSSSTIHAGRARLGWLGVAAAALLALFLLGSGLGALRTAHAQDAAAAEAAAQAALAAELGIDASEITVARTEAANWDGCLGIPPPEGEACTMILINGWVVWLTVDEAAYRYHTNGDGTDVRLAEGPFPAADVADAPIPETAVPDTQAGDAQEEDADGSGSTGAPTGPSTPADIAAALEAGGFTTSIEEIALTQDWIPGSASPALNVDGTIVEVYSLADDASVDSILAALQTGAAVPDANASVWAANGLIVILNDAPQHGRVAEILRGILGEPVVPSATTPAPTDSGDDVASGAGDTPAAGSGDEAAPGAESGTPSGLPNTGSGGLDEGGGLPILAWAGVALGGLGLGGLFLARRMLRDKSGG